MTVADDALHDEWVIAPTRTPHSQRVAADIWARATARRDGLASVASAMEKLPGVQRRLAMQNASLHLAHRRDDVEGFVLLVPHGRAFEITYLAVDPDRWGSGVAQRLLRYVERHARSLQFSTLDLWVIADNQRAIDLYERAGFRTTTDVKDSDGRWERRLERQLTS